MQTLTIELVANDSLQALRDLEQKHLIKIIDKTDLGSYALPGDAISEEDFKKWVDCTENSPTVSFSEAKQRWAAQRKKLEKLIR